MCCFSVAETAKDSDNFRFKQNLLYPLQALSTSLSLAGIILIRFNLIYLSQNPPLSMFQSEFTKQRLGFFCARKLAETFLIDLFLLKKWSGRQKEVHSVLLGFQCLKVPKFIFDFFFLNKWAKFSVFNLIVMIIVPFLYNNQLFWSPIM